MSILEIPEASPARVRAVFRLLLSTEAQRQRRTSLESLLSPPSLPVTKVGGDGDVEDEESGSDRSRSSTMIAKVVSACEKMGLLLQEDEDVLLHPALPSEARSGATADLRLPMTIAALVFDPGNPNNRMLAQLVAWYLMQNPLDPPTNEKAVMESLARTPALADHFGLQNVSYGQFEDWVCYLGFAWAYSGADKKRAITPDPTGYLRRVVPRMFEEAGSQTIPLGSLCAKLASQCPVLEGGVVREEVAQMSNMRLETNTLSPATSQAWFRLEHEGVLKLVRKADAANPVLLDDGGEPVKVADVTLVASRTRTRPRK